MDQSFDQLGVVTIDGNSVLQQTLAPYVTQNSLEFQLQDFAQDIETGTFSLPNPSDYFAEKPPVADINMNGQKISNLAAISLSGGISGLLSTALSLGAATQMFPNTGIQNQTDSVSMENKKLKKVGTAEYVDPLNADLTEQQISERNLTAVNQGFMRTYALVQKKRRGNDMEIIQNQPFRLPYDCFENSSMSATGMEPVKIQGVADPEFPWDAVNKRKLDEELENYVRESENIDLRDDFRVINLPDPTAEHHAANKRYCDGNSKNDDGTGLITGLLGGVLGGSISNALVSSVGQGLSAFGQISGSLAAATAALSSGIKIGTNADFDRYQPSAGESQQLIDNLKSDIANSGEPGGGALMNGAFSASGLFSASRNAQVGIFELNN